LVDPTDNESRARNPVSSASTRSSEARAAAAGARLARELICVALADAHAGQEQVNADLLAFLKS
jgi:hypothetical protein